MRLFSRSVSRSYPWGRSSSSLALSFLEACKASYRSFPRGLDLFVQDHPCLVKMSLSSDEPFFLGVLHPSCVPACKAGKALCIRCLAPFSIVLRASLAFPLIHIRGASFSCFPSSSPISIADPFGAPFSRSREGENICDNQDFVRSTEDMDLWGMYEDNTVSTYS